MTGSRLLSSPTSVEFESAFATLKPANERAQLAFHGVAKLLSDQDTSHHTRFLKVTGNKRLEATAHLQDTATETSSGDEAEAEPGVKQEPAQSSAQKILTGHYEFSLKVLPALPAAGWHIGRGKRRILDRQKKRSNDMTFGVDILLSTDPKDHGVRGVHARILFDRTTGLPMIRPQYRESGIELDGVEWFQDKHVFTKPSTAVRFGPLSYIFQLVELPDEKSLAIYKADLDLFFQSHLEAPEPPTATSSPPSSTDITLQGWVIRRAIGISATSVVSTGINNQGEVVAVKTLTRRNDSTALKVEEEVDSAKLITRLLQNSDVMNRIIQVRDVIYQSGSVESSKWPHEYVWILYTPLARTTFTALAYGKPDANCPFKVKKELFRHILEGLNWLHSHQIVHRDIKPANLGIVTTEPPQAVILDIGSAASFKSSLVPRPGVLGTIGYLAPEIESTAYRSEVDMWSLGVVGHEIFCNRHPWHPPRSRINYNPWRPGDNNERKAQLFQALTELQTTHQDLGSSDPSTIENLLLKMLALKGRISAERALEHSCLRNRPN